MLKFKGMKPQEFKVIYDILQEGYFALSWTSIWWLFGILFFLAVILAWRRNSKLNKSTQGFLLIIASILLLFGIWSVYSTRSLQKNCIDWAQSNDFQVVTGQIKDFRSDFKSESFAVNGVKFVYHEYDVSKCGYRQAKGIQLQNDRFVRISYHDNCILKFEITD